MKKKFLPRWMIVLFVATAFVTGTALGALLVFTVPETHVNCHFLLPESFGIPVPS